MQLHEKVSNLMMNYENFDVNLKGSLRNAERLAIEYSDVLPESYNVTGEQLAGMAHFFNSHSNSGIVNNLKFGTEL
ncbi:hypothetical protein ENHYD8BJ_50368 [Enhydrobacter sp. 8BJ]|nr:hypothetical protein [Enhydrobacter sp. 8BJ]VXB51483.1 hypothetical protein ENHYD8BJ_50368 [Enhydrobacter sp. 8BJ]